MSTPIVKTEDHGIQKLLQTLDVQVVAPFGDSGVGKSYLLNQIIGVKIFESGDSDDSVTTQQREHSVNGITFVNCVGLTNSQSNVPSLHKYGGRRALVLLVLSSSRRGVQLNAAKKALSIESNEINEITAYNVVDAVPPIVALKKLLVSGLARIITLPNRMANKPTNHIKMTSTKKKMKKINKEAVRMSPIPQQVVSETPVMKALRKLNIFQGSFTLSKHIVPMETLVIRDKIDEQFVKKYRNIGDSFLRLLVDVMNDGLEEKIDVAYHSNIVMSEYLEKKLRFEDKDFHRIYNEKDAKISDEKKGDVFEALIGFGAFHIKRSQHKTKKMYFGTTKKQCPLLILLHDYYFKLFDIQSRV